MAEEAETGGSIIPPGKISDTMVNSMFSSSTVFKLVTSGTF